MRTFIAIELPEAIKQHLERLQRELKTAGADVKWVEPQNIHLTLKFLGEIDEAAQDAAVAAMQDSAAKHEAFECSPGTAGAFPRIESARVIWIGLAKGDSEVKKLAADLETALFAAGFPREERPFSSHITLGRTRSAKNIRVLSEKLLLLAAQQPDPQLAFQTKKITLFKSTLTPRGPVYDPIREVLLKS